MEFDQDDLGAEYWESLAVADYIEYQKDKMEFDEWDEDDKLIDVGDVDCPFDPSPIYDDGWGGWYFLTT